MLQFNSIAYIVATKYTPRLLWRLTSSLSGNSMIVTSNCNEQQKQAQYINNEINLERHKIFNELKTKLCSCLHKEPLVINEVQKAQDIDELIQIMKSGDQFSISQDDMLNAFKIIMEWTLNKCENKIKNLNDKDTSIESNIKIPMPMVNNLQNNVPLPYTKFSGHHAIKEIYKLAKKYDRNIPVLSAHFESIIKDHKFMNITYCSSLLYCMGCLSYSDQRLLKKIAECISSTNIISSRACKSMLKSMVIIRYRNETCLEHICKQIINGNIKCEPYEIVNILQSFAMLHHYSTHVNKIIEEYILCDQFKTLSRNDKLNFTWSCAMFRKLKNSHAEFILDKTFISKLLNQNAEKNVTRQMKLLNINAYAKYVLKNYSGPFLDDEQCLKMKNRHQSKQPYTEILKNALKHLLPTAFHFEMNVNTKMGFYLDAEFAVDSKCNFVDIHKVEDNKDFYRVAVLIVDYHHMYLGTTQFISLFQFYNYLLKQRNYIVLFISYQCLKDTVDQNANYIKKKLLNRLTYTVTPIETEI